jgi:tripartite-type tricarboxylate transporter receptor subunit TctC
MRRLIRIAAGAVCAGAALLAAQAAPAAYPERPVRAIVVFPPGGPTDVIARITAQGLTEALGQQVVVDNRVGAGGNIGMGIAAQAAPDGYTLVFVSSSLMVNPSLYKKVPYDVYKSFQPVSVVAASTHVWFTHPSVPVNSIAELIDYAKKNPEKASVATPGVGTVPFLSAYLLILDAKIPMINVPYAGGGPSIAAVLGNQVPFGCQAVPPVTAHIQAGRVRALAVTAEKRTPLMPTVPTMDELGFKGHAAETISAFLVPAGTPAAIVKRLHDETVHMMKQPSYRKRIEDLGADVVANSPQQFSAYIRSEVARWAKVIKQAKIPAN